MKTRLFTLVASILVFSAFSFGQATSNVKQITDNPVVSGMMIARLFCMS